VLYKLATAALMVCESDISGAVIAVFLSLSLVVAI
jgi:hypothetical protein